MHEVKHDGYRMMVWRDDLARRHLRVCGFAPQSY
jgi:hypothetical protein